MRLWVSARIPFTPFRVGTSTGGGNTGLGCLVLFGILLLVPIFEGLAAMPWWGWIVFPAVILSSVAVVWAPWSRTTTKEQRPPAWYSNRR